MTKGACVRQLRLGIDIACRAAHRATLADETGRFIWSGKRFSVNGHWFLPTGGHLNSPGMATSLPRYGHGIPHPRDDHLVRGFTPLPLVASCRRIDSPAVWTTWAWCNRRSTSAVARLGGMS